MEHPSLEPFGLLRAGVEATPAPWNTNREATSWHTLVIVLEGRFQCNSRSGQLTANPNDLLVLPANIERQCVLISESMRICAFWFAPLPIWEPLEKAGIALAPIPYSTRVEHILMLLHEESLAANEDGDELLRHLSLSLVTYLQRIANRAGGPADHRNRRKLAHLWQLVHDDPAFPWDADCLAKRAHISTTHLRRLCHQFYGRALGDMVTRIRMDIASHRLSHEDETMEDLAQSVGYANSYSFSRAFLKATGVRPGAYQKRTRTGWSL